MIKSRYHSWTVLTVVCLLWMNFGLLCIFFHEKRKNRGRIAACALFALLFLDILHAWGIVLVLG